MRWVCQGSSKLQPDLGKRFNQCFSRIGQNRFIAGHTIHESAVAIMCISTISERFKSSSSVNCWYPTLIAYLVIIETNYVIGRLDAQDTNELNEEETPHCET